MFPADIETDVIDGRHRRAGRAASRRPSRSRRCAVAVAGRQGRGVLGVRGARRDRARGAAEERDARSRARRASGAACGAVADALRRADADGCPTESRDAVVPVAGGRRALPNGPPVRVQTARQKDVIVATTLCEAA